MEIPFHSHCGRHMAPIELDREHNTPPRAAAPPIILPLITFTVNSAAAHLGAVNIVTRAFVCVIDAGGIRAVFARPVKQVAAVVAALRIPENDPGTLRGDQALEDLGIVAHLNRVTGVFESVDQSCVYAVQTSVGGGLGDAVAVIDARPVTVAGEQPLSLASAAEKSAGDCAHA